MRSQLYLPLAIFSLNISCQSVSETKRISPTFPGKAIIVAPPPPGYQPPPHWESIAKKDANLTHKQVIQIAIAKAAENGFNLSAYETPTVRFNGGSYQSQKVRWYVGFNGKPQNGGYIAGNHFTIRVDDQTKETFLARGK